MSAPIVRPRRGRPPKVSRDHEDTRGALLRCGMEILTAQGLTATGIESVLKRVDVPKGSFYHYFDSKDAFGLEVLQSYAEYFARKLDRWLLDDSLPPLQRLTLFVEDAKAGMARHRFDRGCLVGNLGQEVRTLPESYRTKLEETLEDWEQRLQDCLRLAVDVVDLPADTDCAALSRFFWIGWEGAVLRTKLARTVEPLDVFFSGFLACARA